jgi:hypothetical protein
MFRAVRESQFANHESRGTTHQPASPAGGSPITNHDSRSDAECAGSFNVAVGHAGSVERGGGMAFAVEEDEAARRVGAMGEFADAGVGYFLGERKRASLLAMRHQDASTLKQVRGHFGHYDFHDAFAVASAGDAAGFGVGVAAAADERGVADASGKFAAGAAGGRAGDEMSVLIESHGADGAGFVADVMFGGVRIFQATTPGGAFAFVDEFFGRAERDTVFDGEFFGAGCDDHHVLGMFENLAREADGIADAFDGGDGAGLQRFAVHDDGVELDAAFGIEMRAKARVECGIVFEDDDGRLDGVGGGAAGGENFPSGFKRAADAGATIFDGLVRDVPCAAVDDQGRFHGVRDVFSCPNNDNATKKQRCEIGDEKFDRRNRINGSRESASGSVGDGFFGA